MTGTKEFSALVEKKVEEKSSVRTLRDLFPDFSPEAKELSVIIFEFLDGPSEGASGKVSKSVRLEAARLILWILQLHTGIPAWSSRMLEQAAQAITKASDDSALELIEVAYEMLGEYEIKLSREVANFSRHLSVTLLSNSLFRQNLKLDWLTNAQAAVSPAQAYFRYYTLALEPELFTTEIFQETRRVLEGTEFYDEIEPVM